MSPTVLLLGNPNCGKSTLFNALTGLDAKVANYPGITVDAKFGFFTSISKQKINIVDLPGTYSLIPASEEELVSTNALLGNIEDLKHDLVAVVIDIHQLRRGLYLYWQVIELGFKAMIILNMADDVSKTKRDQIENLIKNATHTQVIVLELEQEKTIIKLKNMISAILSGSLLTTIKDFPLLHKDLDLSLQSKLLQIDLKPFEFSKHAYKSDDIIKNISLFLLNWHQKGIYKPKHFFDNSLFNKQEQEILEQKIINLPQKRFAIVDNILKDLQPDDFALRSWSDKLDSWFLSPIYGPLLLVLIFFTFIQATFFLAQPICDVIEESISHLATFVSLMLPENLLIRSLLMDGIFAGLGTLLSFIPLLGFLFIFLTILEESGYMARATVLLDHHLKKWGLCGKSVAPLLSSFACAIPSIIACKTINSKKERLITILIIPFITCSARLPVFALITSALFSDYPLLFGFINIAALVFVSMYIIGIIFALSASLLLNKILKNTESLALSIELPVFRIPRIKTVYQKVYERINRFIKDVGGVILASTIIMWALFNVSISYENNHYAFDKASEQKNSVAAFIGHKIEPAVSLMGADWKLGIGILASFLAREVFVSSIAVAYGVNEENNLQKVFKQHVSLASGLSLLLFFTLSLQCISTVIVTKNETKSLSLALLQFATLTLLAYLVSVLVYQCGKLWF